MLLARDLDMPANLERLHVAHMDDVALPALTGVTSARRKVGVLPCVELTSPDIQRVSR